MNRFHKIAAASMVMLLPACASTQKTTYHDAPMRSGTLVVDQQYISAVERVARQRGTQVTWVNAPSKRVALTGRPR
jgi:ribosomal protein L27